MATAVTHARPAGRTENLAKWTVGICFFISGATGLIYENIWVRILGLFYGNTTLAVSAVLAAFMSGLALGAWAIGARADRVKRPLLLYGALEILIGAYSWTSPKLLSMARELYVQHFAGKDVPELHLTLAQFGICFVILILPTALMGATLPILSAGLQRVLGSTQRTVGNLYAINTFGAVFGTLLTAFALLPQLGVSASVTVAAIGNAVIGLTVIAFSINFGEPGREPKSAQSLPATAASPAAAELIGTKRDPVPVGFLMFAFFCTGLSALTLEVAWTRTLCMFLGSSVYGFALILMSFLIGLALGSWIFARIYAERPVTLGLFGGVACGIGITCLALSALFPYLPYAFLGLYVGFTFMPLWVLYTLQFAVCLSVTLVPTCMMGMTFPIVAKICADRSGKLGDAVGKSYAANTAGAIVGSGLSGLLFIPLLGLQGTVRTFSVAYVVVGAIAVVLGIAASADKRSRTWLPFLRAVLAMVAVAASLAVVGGIAWFAQQLGLVPMWTVYALAAAVAIIAGPAAWVALDAAGRAAYATTLAIALSVVGFLFLPPWHKGALTSGIFRQSFGSTSGVGNIQRSDEDIIFYKEGTSCTVSVIQGTDADGGIWKSLAVNGKADASTLPADMITQQLTGHLPVLLQDTPSKCLLIGLGSGCSAAAICSHDDVREVEVAELEHQVVEGAKYLSEINRGVLEEGAEPKLKIRVMDGRTTLLGSEGVYDIVISEPSNPWISGVSNLFTTEHYEACRKALRPTGTFCQWAQGYDLNRETLHMMFATLQKVFPRATVWQTTNYDYLFIARMDGKPVDYQRLVDKFRTNAQLKKDLTPYRHASPGGILACYVMGPEKLAEIAQGGQVNHDDLPLLEFWAPKGLYDHDPQGIFKWVRGYASKDLPKMTGFDATQVDWAQLRVDMGNALFNKEIYSEARENALRALDANADYAPAYVLLGEAEWKLDRPIRALRALEQARDLNPFDLNAHLLLAQLHIETGLPQQALAEAQAARTLQPENDQALRLINRANAQLAELGQRADVLGQGNGSAVE